MSAFPLTWEPSLLRGAARLALETMQSYPPGTVFDGLCNGMESWATYETLVAAGLVERMPGHPGNGYAVRLSARGRERRVPA